MLDVAGPVIGARLVEGARADPDADRFYEDPIASGEAVVLGILAVGGLTTLAWAAFVLWLVVRGALWIVGLLGPAS